MPHEKLHDSSKWKNKLDDLDHLPGEPLTGKAAAWEKLQARLQDKPRKTKVWSYWMAAASLLLVAGITWFMMDQKGTGMPQDHVQQTGENIIKNSIPVKGKEDTAVVANVRIDNKPTPTAKREKNKVHLSPGVNSVIEKQTSMNEEIANNPSPEITGNNNNHSDTAASIAVMPAKKKLRIVHINELQKSEEEAQWVRKAADPDSFSGSLARNHNHSGISISKNASDNLLKIKLTPSN